MQFQIVQCISFWTIKGKLNEMQTLTLHHCTSAFTIFDDSASKDKKNMFVKQVSLALAAFFPIVYQILHLQS